MTTSAALFSPVTQPALFNAQGPVAPSVSPPLGQAGANGAISGGLLRPGAIDQATFARMLQQQQQNRQAAGVGGRPVQMPVQNFQPAIPTLSSAQFAALVGAQEEATAPAPETSQVPPVAAQQAAAAATLRLSGTANRNTGLSAQANTKPADAEPEAEDADMPSITRASDAQQVASAQPPAADTDLPEITRKGEQTAATAAASAKENPSAESETAAKSDPDVVHLKSPPDKEQVTELRMRHKRWVVDETPGARQLFFGPDGEFGWDDFLDMINPLQHIPGVAQIYRAVTGDESYGAANLLGAIPFGPLGGPAMIASIADLAVKDVTGNDIGDNLVAMVFGGDKKQPGDTGTAAPADMAEAAPAQTDESDGAPVQTASLEGGYSRADASQMHSDCRG